MAEEKEVRVNVTVRGYVDPLLGYVSFKGFVDPLLGFETLERFDGIDGEAKDFSGNNVLINISQEKYQEVVTLRLEGKQTEELLVSLRKWRRVRITARSVREEREIHLEPAG